MGNIILFLICCCFSFVIATLIFMSIFAVLKKLDDFSEKVDSDYFNIICWITGIIITILSFLIYNRDITINEYKNQIELLEEKLHKYESYEKDFYESENLEEDTEIDSDKYVIESLN